MLFVPTRVPWDNLWRLLGKSWPNPVPVEDAGGSPTQFGLLDPMPQEIVTWGGGFPLCGQNVRGTEIPNACPSLLCPAETGRRAAAFPTLHNFHFNGFSFFFSLLCVSFHFS